MALAGRFDDGWLAPMEAQRLISNNTPIVYQLLIRLTRSARPSIGALGRVRLPAGYYVYSGSAKSAGAARLARHMRTRKPRRWHIDYLLSLPQACVVAVRLWQWRRGLECAVNHRLGRLKLAEPIVYGFGSGDCRAGCRAHFLMMTGSIDAIKTM